ncbi:hypothetical protein B0187_01180 [Haemophilus paracuniculus]|uniref:Uncharacterized protein n=1 Tax=Haemophilus paracuniculus TaxID=734 RepID=A0A1T0AVX8_9PAST|nr:hypothetical protein B0187_01180 [Haemophilus paracuniculus]
MQKSNRSLLFPILFFIGLNLVIFSLSRLGLALWQAERVTAVNGWLPLFTQGLRIDISVLCWLLGVPALLTTLLFYNNLLGKIWQVVLRLWLTIVSVLILFMEAATPAYIKTLDRPNLEVLISIFAITLVATVVYWKLSGWATRNIRFPNWKWRSVLVLLVIAVMVAGGRSILGYRGINPAIVAFSNDPLVNRLVLNSGYLVLFAVQQFKDEDKSSEQ